MCRAWLYMDFIHPLRAMEYLQDPAQEDQLSFLTSVVINCHKLYGKVVVI